MGGGNPLIVIYAKRAPESRKNKTKKILALIGFYCYSFPAMEQINKTLTATQEKTLFAVYTNTDLTEGRGNEYIHALTEKEITAKRLAKGRYVQGTDATVKEVKAFFIPISEGYTNIGEWFAPAGLIHKPTKEDEQNEKIFLEEKAKTILLEKFKEGKNLTQEEREEIIKYLK
jgi:hypothetical protein